MRLLKLNKLTQKHSFLVVALSLSLPVLGQPVLPPTPAPSSQTSINGVIAQVNFGTEGDVKSFIIGRTIVDIRGGSLVLGRFQPGHQILAEGYVETLRTGFSRMRATRITNTTLGVTLEVSPAETAFNGTGQVRQYNYNDHGEIIGLVLTNGDLVRTPARLAAVVMTLAPLGATVQIEGWAKRTVLGRTSIRATHLNGQLLQPAPTPGAPKPAPPKPAAPK